MSLETPEITSQIQQAILSTLLSPKELFEHDSFSEGEDPLAHPTFSDFSPPRVSSSPTPILFRASSARMPSVEDLQGSIRLELPSEAPSVEHSRDSLRDSVDEAPLDVRGLLWQKVALESRELEEEYSRNPSIRQRRRLDELSQLIELHKRMAAFEEHQTKTLLGVLFERNCYLAKLRAIEEYAKVVEANAEASASEKRLVKIVMALIRAGESQE